MHANKREELEEVRAGDICATVALKSSITGDTLATKEAPVLLETIKFPEPVVTVAVEPKTQADHDKLSAALFKISTEDPTFKVRRDAQTGQTVISGMGELHLEVILERIKREFKVLSNVGAPQVAYRETLTQPSEAQGRYIKQSGGKGQYGDVWIKVEPLKRGEGFVFEDKIIKGVIPKEYIPAVEQGIREALDNGILAGFLWWTSGDPLRWILPKSTLRSSPSRSLVPWALRGGQKGQACDPEPIVRFRSPSETMSGMSWGT